MVQEICAASIPRAGVLFCLAGLSTYACSAAADEIENVKGMTQDLSQTMDQRDRQHPADIGAILISQQKWEQAYRFYTTVINNNPGNTEGGARMQRMICAAKLKRWQQVVDDATYLLNTHKGGMQWKAKILTRRGAAYSELKKYDLACADYKEVIVSWPDARAAYVELEKNYRLAGKKSEAQSVQKQIDELDKDIRPF